MTPGSPAALKKFPVLPEMMSPIPDHIRTSIAQRQRQRARCAQTIELLLAEPQLASMAAQFLETAMHLLHEDECDLNGTPGVRAAISVEKTGWEALQHVGVPPICGDELRRASGYIETIKRAIEVQATLMDLAIPTTAGEHPFRALLDEYSQRYPDHTRQKP
jgi:hypothetical protein